MMTPDYEKNPELGTPSWRKKRHGERRSARIRRIKEENEERALARFAGRALKAAREE